MLVLRRCRLAMHRAPAERSDVFATAGLDTSAQKGVASDWREVIHKRLRGDFDSIDTGPGTADTENGLGWQPQSYWFIDRVFETYSRALLVWRIEPDRCDSCATLPFDSGGLWHDYIGFAGGVDADAKASFAKLNSTGLPDGAAKYRAWIVEAFPTLGDYVTGRTLPSKQAATSEVVPELNPFAWSWELRHPKSSRCEALVLDRGFMSRVDRKALLMWLEETLSDPEWKRALQTLPAVLPDYPSDTDAKNAAMVHLASSANV
jgi:hypothetical protein